MAKSRPVRAFLSSVVMDESPDAPVITTFDQLNNTTLKIGMQLPNKDAGSPTLTGLTHANFAEFALNGGVDPTDGMTPDEVLALPGINLKVIGVTQDQGGQTINDTMPFVHAGLELVLVGWVDDD